jgi:hypothetical protein
MPSPSAGVLICGLPRSGTTLVQTLLAGHPAFAVPEWEMGWWVDHFPRYRGARTASQWSAFVHDLMHAATTRSLELDREGLERDLRGLAPGRCLDAFDAILTAYARQQGRPRWGEKTPLAEFYARDVLDGLPGARIVHVVRDPRDVFLSLASSPYRIRPSIRARVSQYLRRQAAWTVRNWLLSTTLARENRLRFPDRYEVLRYEDLVARPEDEVRRLCAFLGEPYVPRALDLDAYAAYARRGGNSSFERLAGVSESPVGRFRSLLEPRLIALTERLAGAPLEEWGYAPAHPRLAASDAFRLLVLDRPWSVLVYAAHGATLRLRGIARP